MTPKELEEYLNKVALDLGEHFDHVEILTSWNEGGLSHTLMKGCGNWYARQGLAHFFINQDIAQDNAQELAQALNDSEPNDGDEWKSEDED